MEHPYHASHNFKTLPREVIPIDKIEEGDDAFSEHMLERLRSVNTTRAIIREDPRSQVRLTAVEGGDEGLEW